MTDLTEKLGERGLARLRYTTSHPRDMDDELIAAHRDLPTLMPFLHLPVQSGSDRILRAMNRRHDADEYRRLIAKIREARPDIALSSDFIVGFPGETDAEFEETLRLAAEIRFASAFSFKYSPRPGTPAADIASQVPEPVMAERLGRLQAQLEADRQDFNRSTVGEAIDLLIEKPGRHPGQLAGKSPYLQAVQVEGADARIGDIIPVRITRAGSNSLFAEPVEVQSIEQRQPLTAAA
jgi:tRNA-2-methylthio-N6-dimethylallyladenosine synthase